MGAQPDACLNRKKIPSREIFFQPQLQASARGPCDGKIMRILLVEDDHSLGSALRDQMVSDGHAVDWMTGLEDALAVARSVSCDLVLLDLGLPDGHGLDLLRDLRQRRSPVPVIILTARDRISDRIAGLDGGADDYLVKPFDLRELSARVAAVFRRYTGDPNPRVRLGDLDIDRVARQLFRDGQEIALTAHEWALLARMLQQPGAVLSKSQLEDSLYAFGSEIESNAIEVYISRLRKKLGRDAIRTIRGLGYGLRP